METIRVKQYFLEHTLCKNTVDTTHQAQRGHRTFLSTLLRILRCIRVEEVF